MSPKTGMHEWQIVCEPARALGYDVTAVQVAAVRMVLAT
jgi:hypothetical protein